MKKEHDYLICIDSDGCAMDTMNSKHFYCFGPEWVKQYGLENIKEEALKYWNRSISIQKPVASIASKDLPWD